MKGFAFLSGLISGLLTSVIVLPAAAQITSDGTTNTRINQSGNNFNILDGVQKGNNLFHSFKEFSINKGDGVVFNNSIDVMNIINRVTGGNISNINGLIEAKGNANLFLINPAGLVFGEDARLNIGGSFLATTAETILFKDGFEFSAVNVREKPLLTVSVPVGLQMGINPGEIRLNGNGHNLINGNAFSPSKNNTNESNLKVESANVLALIGGKISLDGSIVTAESGNIELASIREGKVNLSQTNQKLIFDYTEVSQLSNIELFQKSLINTNGIKPGSIQIIGENLTVNDGSIILIQNLGLDTSGNININVANSLNINGSSLDGSSFSSLLMETFSDSNSGDINLKGKNLILKDGAIISNNSYSSGNSGSIDLDFSDSVLMTGFSPIIFKANTITTVTFASGNTGNINLSTTKINMSDGSFLGPVTFGDGNSGDITVNSSDSIELVGISPASINSAISTSTFGTGNAGELTVNTQKLTVKNGARIDSSAVVNGNSGSVTVNASEFVEVSGVAADARIPSSINSSANILDEPVRKMLGLPDKPFGDSGNVTINTPDLTVTDGALVSVRNQGFGNGGILEIHANTVNLNNKGGITAATESGKGGNINISLQDSLLMRRGSFITTESLGIGNGGNIDINSPIIYSFENSDIVANAVEGNGGNIEIKTQGIFGLNFRDKLTLGSDITASSEYGINGTVEINNFGIDPSSGLIDLSVELSDSSQQITTGCLNKAGNNFVVTRRGGIPHNPSRVLNINNHWFDIRNLSSSRRQNLNIGEITAIINTAVIVEATGFRRNQKGEIELIASTNKPLSINPTSDCNGMNT